MCVLMMNNYDSDTDPLLLDKQLMYHLNIANKLYQTNGMFVNPAEHQAMIRDTQIMCFLFQCKNQLNRPFSKMAAKNSNRSILKTYTSTRKNTFTLVTLPSFSILGLISAEKM